MNFSGATFPKTQSVNCINKDISDKEQGTTELTERGSLPVHYIWQR